MTFKMHWEGNIVVLEPQYNSMDFPYMLPLLPDPVTHKMPYGDMIYKYYFKKVEGF
jgi:hypothetical protein